MQISCWSDWDTAELVSARGGGSPGLAAQAGPGVPSLCPSTYGRIRPAPSDASASQ